VTVDRIMPRQGALVDGVGIRPDVNVSLTVSDMVRGEDTQPQAALRVLAALDRHPASRAA